MVKVSVYENFYILRYNHMKSDKSQQTFRRNIVFIFGVKE
jgi:hypothetical protein